MESLELMPVRVRITSILKKALFAGEYKSGDELSLTEIAEKLGVSRTPVREAFQTLAAEGLIELRMNRGAVVKPIDDKFIRDHYEMRILLEGEAAVRAANRDMDVSDLLEEQENLWKVLDSTPRQVYVDLNQKLHTRIWEAADNQKLYHFLSGLWNGPSTGLANSEQEHFRRSTEEHIRLLRAIGDHQPDQARSIMELHISRSCDNILRSFEKAHRL